MMKKLFAILMSLCVLCAACTVLADMEIPTWDSMPKVVMEDENTTVDEAAFEGEWVLNVAFAGTEYVDEATLFDSYGFNFMPYRIADGKVMQDIQNEYGEFNTLEMPYIFEAGQLQGRDASGRDFAVPVDHPYNSKSFDDLLFAGIFCAGQGVFRFDPFVMD